MTDSYGGLQIPAQTPEQIAENTGKPVDAVIDAFGGYLQAYLNAKLGDMWAAVAPGLTPVVRRVYTAKPQDVILNESTLPALFIWRTRLSFSQMADDIRIDESVVSVLWLLDPGDPIKRENRLRMLPAVANMIDAAVDEGRDPSWIDPADPDPEAALYGSVLMYRAGLIKPPYTLTAEPTVITVESTKSETTQYSAFTVQIQTMEQRFRDPATGRYVSGVQSTQTQGSFSLGFELPTP